MEIKRPWFSGYVGEKTYIKLYGKVADALKQNSIHDKFSVIQRDSYYGTIGGIFRELDYECLFDALSNFQWPGYCIKRADREKGEIFAKHSAWAFFGRAHINFYQHLDGVWIEAISERYGGTAFKDRCEEAVKYILTKVQKLDVVTKTKQQLPNGLRSLDDRIVDILGTGHVLEAKTIHKATTIS